MRTVNPNRYYSLAHLLSIYTYVLSFYQSLPLDDYGQVVAPDYETSLIASTLILYHVKRIIETLFVYKYSEEEIELYSAFSEVTYYVSFAALISQGLFHKEYYNTNGATRLEELALGIFVLLALSLCLSAMMRFK